MNTNLRKWLIGFGILILLFSTVLFFYFRYRFGIIRYFDIDEVAYMHWAHDFFSGKKPYTDFFFFIPPLYLYTLSPLFSIVGRSSEVLLLARTLAFVYFLLSSVGVFLIVRLLKGTKTAFLALFIFAFLPMPVDKWIEIRPDGLATAIQLFGIYFLIKGFSTNSKKWFFLSGLFYFLSLVILPKVLVFTAVALIILGLFIELQRRKKNAPLLSLWKNKHIQFFSLGGIIPIAILIFLFISYGNVGKAIYLTTTISKQATVVLGNKFPIPADQFFRPHEVYFGIPWYSMGWRWNLYVWQVAIVWAIVHLVSFIAEKNVSSRLSKLLVSASFLLYFAAYLYTFPLKHAQYLVFLAPFASYYAADFLMSLFRKLRNIKRVGEFTSVFVAFIIWGILFWSTYEMFQAKLNTSNKEELKYYNNIYNLLPPQEPVFDLSGESVFYPSGYYFCCIPYGQYEEALTFSYPSLEHELRAKKVKFLYVQNPSRIGVLPVPDQKILSEYYMPFSTPVTSSFWAAGAKISAPYMNSQVSFNLIAEGNYELVGVEASKLSTYIIDGKRITTSPIYLKEGKHIIIMPDKGELMIRYMWN